MNVPSITSGGVTITEETVKKLLGIVDAGLSRGLGRRRKGSMCVEAAVCYSLGLPHNDDPPCVAPIIRDTKITLNDSQWSSRAARARGMRRLSVLQLGTKEDFNNIVFAKKLVIMTIRTILPPVLIAANFPKEAKDCAAVATFAAARAAADAAARAAEAAADAADAAADAASPAAYAAADAAARAAYAADDAARAVYAAADAARAAARYAAYYTSAAARAADAAEAVRGDEILFAFAKGFEDILIEMKVPGTKFLYLLDGE